MSKFALPTDLRAGIKSFLSGISGADIADRAQSISQNYKRGGSSREVVTSSADVAAYLVTRAPACFAAAAAALSAFEKRAPSFAPLSVLDVGSGPGTASWAAVQQWPGIKSVTLLDENEEMMRAARTLCSGTHQEALRTANFKRARIGAKMSEGVYDLVVASYAIGELNPADRNAALETLRSLAAHALVIVEPGTPEGFALIRDARDLLVEGGAEIAAPCPHAQPCPMTPPDWCHFGQILPRSRDHMRAKGGTLPFEVEKFSYVVSTRGVSLEPANARIIDRPGQEKFGMKFRLCGREGISECVILKRDRPAYRGAARRKWGDTLPV